MDEAGIRFAGEIRNSFGNKAIITPHEYYNEDNSRKDSGDFVRHEVAEYFNIVKQNMDNLRL